MRRWLAGTAAMLLIGCSVTAVGAQTAPAMALEEGLFEVRGTAVPVDHGRLRVPANRTAGSSATITLGFVRFRSTAAAPAAPIVFLAGGPGDAATRALAGIPLDLLDRLRAIADVIAFDQRGTGTSEPAGVRCPPRPMLPTDRALDPADAQATLERQLLECLATAVRSGVDVMGLTTEESAGDLEALRVALGAPRLTLLAGSYGTHLALATAQRFPDSIDRLVLLGVEGPDDTFKLPSRIDAVVERIGVALRPTLIDDVRTLRHRLAGEPVGFTFANGRTIVLGEWDLQRWLSESLDTRREIDAMVLAVPDLLAGEYAALAEWALRYRMPRTMNLMGVAMDCASNASAERHARIRREATQTLLADVMDFPLPRLCEVPGLPRLADAAREPVVSDVPALLVSGTFDGRTPVENAEEVARGMPNSRVLVIDGVSHDLFQSDAATTAMLEFLAPRE